MNNKLTPIDQFNFNTKNLKLIKVSLNFVSSTGFMQQIFHIYILKSPPCKESKFSKQTDNRCPLVI